MQVAMVNASDPVASNNKKLHSGLITSHLKGEKPTKQGDEFLHEKLMQMPIDCLNMQVLHTIGNLAKQRDFFFNNF